MHSQEDRWNNDYNQLENNILTYYEILRTEIN